MATGLSEPSILIVEDQEGPRKALRMILGSFCRIYTAEAASIALEIIAGRPVDLVIIDVGLPDYSGIELLRRVRARGCDVKVIVMTGGDGSAESAEEAMRLGAVAYLLKPFNFLEVIALVKDVIKIDGAESVSR